MPYDYLPRELLQEREPHRPLLTEAEALAIQRGVARYGGREWVRCARCEGSGKGQRRYAMCGECQGAGVVEEGEDG